MRFFGSGTSRSDRSRPDDDAASDDGTLSNQPRQQGEDHAHQGWSSLWKKPVIDPATGKS